MKRVQKILLGISAFTALGLSAGSTWAEADGFGMMGPEACAHERGMMGGRRGIDGPRGPNAKSQADFAAAAAARLDKLKGELKITAEQETAWQAFAGKAKQQVENMQSMRGKLQPPAASATASATPATLSAPERMDKGIEFMKQRLSNMEAMNASLKDLYAALTPEQRVIADKHFTHHPEQRERRMMRRATPAAK